jgi:hypothetical protein
MRAHYIIVAVLILLGLGVKMTSFTALTAETVLRSKRSVSVDVSQMHQNTKNLQVEQFHDMTLVFPVFPGGD